jgi:protein-S-isoprenylcysteine O-methyltransferase Ste14
VNAIYIPLLEEPGLERRFGADYVLYKRNVPRWIPRLRAWSGPPGE